jgi:hypothetical protein
MATPFAASRLTISQISSCDRVAIGVQRNRLAVDANLTGIGARHAEQRQRQLGAARTRQPGDAENFSPIPAPIFFICASPPPVQVTVALATTET